MYCSILDAFKDHLTNEGYEKLTISAIFSAVAEFFSRLEKSFEVFDIKHVAPRHIQKHYEYLETRLKYGRTLGGLSASMLKAHIYALRMLFAFLARTNVIDANPLSGNLDFAISGNPYRLAITEVEVQTLFSASSKPIEKVLLCLAYSGMRRREIERLNCQDILWKEQYLIVVESKFHKRRELPLTQKMLDYMQVYYNCDREAMLNRQNEDSRKAFMLNKDGNRLSGGLAYKMFKEILYRTSLERSITLHTLRHSFATHLKMRGCPIETIQILMGHGSMDVTTGYLKFQEQALFQKSNKYEH